jgi:uncharacterized protein YydD (DUF2326 family)
MKLKQLYADKKFKNVEFNSGINLVLAKVTKKLDLNRDSHNLGKTTLIAVIDFMLLKELDSTHIFYQYKTSFSGYTFYLEILLNTGSYLTIRRSVDQPTRISFKLSKISSKLIGEKKWDHAHVSFGKAQDLLNEFLAFDVLKNWDYRKSVTYFLRSQKDYHDVFQLSKFAKGKDIDWKPFMFDLLGFNGQLLTDKYRLDTDIEEQNKFISSLKTKFAVDAEELDKIKGAIELKREEKRELEEQIDNFNFYNQERRLNKELVEDIERMISDLNSQEYNLEYEIDKINDSFKNKISFDINQLKKIYADAQIFFPDNLVNDYKQLEEFNKKITEERDKYLEERLVQTTNELIAVRSSLLEYNQRRNKILSVLKDKDAFKKFKSYQIDLTKVEGEISKLHEKLNSIDKISVLNDHIKQLTDELQKFIREIGLQIATADNKIYSEIRKQFRNIFKYIVNSPAIIFLRQNKEGNVEFKVDVSKPDEVEVTAEGKGNTYEKLLCISFDMAVLIAYHKKSFFRFVYHDGALEGLDNRKKENYINLIRRSCEAHNIQYIFTSIQDDIPPHLLRTFKPHEICLTLDDKGDSGKLFGFSF